MPRVLVVDDERTVLFAMRDYFDSLGLSVDCAPDHETAIELLRKTDYAVAIIDLRLSGSDDREGLAVLRYVTERALPIRTVVLTAYGSDEVASELRLLGADAYFKKPKSLPELAVVVCELSGHPLPPALARK